MHISAFWVNPRWLVYLLAWVNAQAQWEAGVYSVAVGEQVPSLVPQRLEVSGYSFPQPMNVPTPSPLSRQVWLLPTVQD